MTTCRSFPAFTFGRTPARSPSTAICATNRSHRTERSASTDEVIQVSIEQITPHISTNRRLVSGEKPYICKTVSRPSLFIAIFEVLKSICLQCGKSFSAKETLNRHVKVHTGERPHKCTFCSKSFIQSTQLRAHMFNHTGENGFDCDQCDKKFNRKTRLESHIKKEHLNEGSHECDTCGKKFAKKRDLKSHQLIHEDLETESKAQTPFTYIRFPSEAFVLAARVHLRQVREAIHVEAEPSHSHSKPFERDVRQVRQEIQRANA